MSEALFVFCNRQRDKIKLIKHPTKHIIISAVVISYQQKRYYQQPVSIGRLRSCIGRWTCILEKTSSELEKTIVQQI